MATKTAELTPADEKWGYPFAVDGVMSVKDAASFAGVDRDTIYAWRTKGLVRLGATGKVCRRSLTNYLHSLEK